MSAEAPTVSADGRRRRDVRRAAVLLGTVAVVFYVGFIAMMIWRATR